MTIVANFFIKIIVYLSILLLLLPIFPCHADVMRKERLSLLRAGGCVGELTTVG
jgi:hypothetical protein